MLYQSLEVKSYWPHLIYGHPMIITCCPFPIPEFIAYIVRCPFIIPEFIAYIVCVPFIIPKFIAYIGCGHLTIPEFITYIMGGHLVIPEFIAYIVCGPFIIPEFIAYIACVPFIIQSSGNDMSTSLCNVFNASISSCDFPSSLKWADINPIYKKKDNLCKQNHKSLLYQLPTKTSTGRLCIRHYIPELLSKTPECMTEKLDTHSLSGFSNYMKNYCIRNYNENCLIENCYICQNKKGLLQ